MKRLLIAMLILLAPCATLAGTAQVRAMLGMWGAAGGTATSYILQDTFYAPSDVTLASTTPDVGDSWTIRDTGEVPYVGATGLRAGDGTSNAYRGQVTPSGVNYSITVAGNFVTADSGSRIGCILRSDTAIAPGSGVLLYVTGAGAWTAYEFYSNVAISSGSVSDWNYASTYYLSISYSGGTFTFKIKDSTMVEKVNTTWSYSSATVGYPWVYLLAGYGRVTSVEATQ